MGKRGPSPSPKTEIRRRVVVELAREGKTAAEIAAVVNRTQSYVRFICYQAKQPIRRVRNLWVLSEEQKAQAARLIRRGMPITHVAQDLKTGHGAVRRFAIAHGLIHPRRRDVNPWGPSEDALLRKHYGPRGNAMKLARMLGMTKNAVIGRAYRLGLGGGSDADGKAA